MNRKIIDTHIHVWDLDRADYPWLEGDQSLLNRNWSLDELEEERKEAGVTSGVLVQAAGNDDDTNHMLDIARKNDWIEGVVAWLPLTDTYAMQKKLQEEYLDDEYFKGVRHQIHDETDAGWLLQSSVIESLRVLAELDIPFDLVGIKAEHIETALEVSEKVPCLRMVFDHLNQPPPGDLLKGSDWHRLMKKAAGREQFYAKISGLGTATGKGKQWRQEDIKPSIAFVLEEFGTNRCFCGGDWPVSLLASSYQETWKRYQNVLGELLNEDEQEKVFATNAELFYGL